MHFWRSLVESHGFMPHGMCYLWTPSLIWLHVVSDALIGLAYTAIPITLIRFVRRRSDLPFHWMFVCFGVFIVACGATHIMEIWTVWNPSYWTAGGIKAVTALASVPTAFLLVRLMPDALALPSPTQLAALNRELQVEIEERREAERQLSRAREGLERRVEERTRELAGAVRVRDEFLSIAGHELKTPLTALVLQLDTLRRSGEEVPAALKGRIERVGGSVQRLTALVEELLDVSRITSGTVAVRLESVDLSEVVREVCASFHDEAARAGTSLRLQVDGAMPAVSDRMRVAQIVLNLLTNATKYGRGKPIDVVLERVGVAARLTVRDYGIGIDPRDQERIFERFERAVSGRNYGGFGLGLWIVRQTAETLGGRIRVQSEPGHGAEFIVELPLRTAEA
jgi:signal transduction histidine kinase